MYGKGSHVPVCLMIGLLSRYAPVRPTPLFPVRRLRLAVLCVCACRALHVLPACQWAPQAGGPVCHCACRALHHDVLPGASLPVSSSVRLARLAVLCVLAVPYMIS